ncbi:hypothetical protein CUT44_13725 [Streptomyces carminius]|uniref:SMI1/KNR4 family protein n=1 Tax=Streptomyces carminius TaxID=2665496 RepID=A0A2M8LZ65_9ACTN|nr:hypothetical protein [Streptomyces carminius]PJE97224.1 hypothetical protein CUT44_13725 [Streptomyces carminius]
MRNNVERLSDLLTVFGGDAGDNVDWEAIKSCYGTDFPEDYKEFVRLFGNGTIEGMIGIRIPVATSDPMIRRVAPLPAAALASSNLDRWAEPSLASLYRLDQILVWGETDSADTLGWIAKDQNPEKWPLAVYERGDGVWKIYDCGMVEFLVKLLQEEFTECPISDTSLMGITNPRFLHDREEERLAEQGVYPWREE